MTAWGDVQRAYAGANPATGFRYASPQQTMALANLVHRWRETHTASFMDDAVIYCEKQGLPILPVLLREIAKAAQQRRGNGPSKAEREGIKGEAFRIMCNLILVGASDREAAGKAAFWTQSTPHPMRASSLEKEYPAAWRRGSPSIEEQIRADRAEWPEPTWDAEWRRLRQSMPEPEDEVRGERR